MKIAFYMEDGLEQLVFTPETDTEKAMLGKLHDGTRTLDIKKGSFFQCRGGWMRHGIYAEHHTYGFSTENDESTMIVLRPKPPENPDLSGPESQEIPVT